MARGKSNYLVCAALLFAGFGVRTAIAADLKEMPATVMEKVVPEQARAGDIVTVVGQTLDAAHVKEVFLTDRVTQVPVEIVVQTDKTLKFKMPQVEAGRWHLAVRIVRDDLMLEEPVVIIALPVKG